MHNYTRDDLNQYLTNDWILDLINKSENNGDRDIRTNKWLKEIDAKRMIYADVYGDLLKIGDKKVLDIGGGVNSLTKILAQKNDYTLLDFMAHGGEQYTNRLVDEYHMHFLEHDWYGTDIDNYDIIIANDIFPDVDQRLETMIGKMLPRCQELRVVITYYNYPRFYTTKRIDDPEIMTFLSWDGEITALKLQRFLDYSPETTDEELEYIRKNRESIYRNGRGVSYIRFANN